MNTEFAGRLLRAMQVMDNPKKDKTATVPTKSGGKYTYKYTQLDDVLSAIRPPLLDNGLVLLQGVTGDDRLVCSVTDGETTLVMDSRPFRPTGDSQAQGSYETYMRRYQLLTAFGLAGEDDDGAASVNQPARKQQRQQQQQQPQSQWQQLLSTFYKKCGDRGWEPSEVWQSMVGDLGFNPHENDAPERIAAAMGWVNRME